MAMTIAFVLFEYFTSPFELSDAIVENDPGIVLAPRGTVPIPKVGVRLSYNQGGGIADPNLIDVVWVQHITSTQHDSQFSVELPSESCSFKEERSSLLEANCPKQGYLRLSTLENGTKIVDVDASQGNSSISVPRIQGLPADSEYSYLEVKYLVNTTILKSLSKKDYEQLFAGVVRFVAVTRVHNLKEMIFGDRVPDRLESKFTYQDLKLKEAFVSELTVNMAIRSIEKGNIVLDFDAFEGDFMDAIIQDSVVEVNDIETEQGERLGLQGFLNAIDSDETFNERLLFARVTCRMSKDFEYVRLDPSATLGDVLGNLGGLFSLFAFVIGLPALYCNRHLFKVAVQKARKRGLLDENLLKEDGSIRIDKADEVVELLNKISVVPNVRKTLNTSTTFLRESLGRMSKTRTVAKVNANSSVEARGQTIS